MSVVDVASGVVVNAANVATTQNVHRGRNARSSAWKKETRRARNGVSNHAKDVRDMSRVKRANRVSRANRVKAATTAGRNAVLGRSKTPL